MLKRITLLLIISIFSLSVKSAVVLNQSSTSGGSTGMWSSITEQQTFVPTLNGKLFRVRVQTATYASSTNVFLNIYSGVPGSGVLLTSMSYFKGSNINSWDDVILPGIGVNVTSGSNYYIEIATPTQVDWIYSPSNPYAPGSAYRGGIQPSNDYNFEIYLAVPTCGSVVNGSNQAGVIANTSSAPLALNAGGDPGNWTSSGAGTFVNPHDPNTTYTPNCSEAGSVTTVTWTSSCNSVGYSQTISVAPPSLNVANVAICNGSSVILNATGASSYTWSANAGGATTNSVTVSPTITTAYTVTGVQSNGCTVSLSPMVTVYSLPSASTGTDVTVCNSGPSTSFTITPSGGTPGYVYEWYNVPTGGTPLSTTQVYLVSPGPGVYTYYGAVKDANNCVSPRDPVQLTVYPLPTMNSVTTYSVDCFGNFTGGFDGNAIGGTAPYEYSYDGGTNFSPNTTTGLPAGSYTVHARDANGCISSNWQMGNINQPPLISLSSSVSNVTCAGGSNGTANITASGGVGGYNYSWSPIGGTSANASGLPPGTYTCNVNDLNGCPATTTVSISQPAALILTTVSQNSVTCNGGSNGAATVSATGGTGGYIYSWTPFGGSAATATGLTAGLYTCTVTDANGCTANQFITINQPAPITLSTGGNSSPCSATAMSISLTPSGGTPGYTFSWNTTNNANTTGETVTPVGTASTINDIVTNLTTGAIALTYTVTVTDASSCSAIFNVPATIAPAPTLTPISNQTLCAGSNTGAITFTPSIGGSTISWTNSNPSIGIAGSGNSDINPTPVTNGGGSMISGNFSATANFSGCVGAAQNFTINVNPNPVINLTATTNPICVGSTSTLNATGANMYTWTPAGSLSASTGSTVTANPATTTTYTVVGTNTLTTCQNNAILTLTVNPAPTISGTLSSCVGASSSLSGSASPNATTPWVSSNTGIATVNSAGLVTGISAGVSTITYKNTNNCTTTATFTVNATPVTPVPTANNVCFGSSTLFTTSAIAGATFSWNFGDATTSTLQNPSHNYAVAGVYTASVTATVLGCTSAVGTVNATVSPASVGGTITGGTSPACSGSNSGTLTLTGSTGNVNGWEFSTNGGASWTPIANTTFSQVYSNLTTTTSYRAIVQSGTCSAVTSTIQTITINNPPSAAFAGTDQSLCNLTSTTLAATNPTIGTGSWSVISGTAVVTNSTSPTSGVTGLTIGASSTLRWITSNSPCASSTDDVIITSNPNPTIGGTLAACVGGSSTLTGSGTTSSWSSSNTSVAVINASTGIVNAIAAGTSTITYLNTTGCSVVATFTVNANPPASITAGGPTTFCSGANVLLSANVGPYTYQWMSGVTPIGGATSSSYTATNAGNHTVVITDGLCQTTSNMININVNPLPSGTAATTNISCNGAADGAVNVTPTGTGPFMFSYNNGTFITASSQTNLSQGNYTVNVQSGAGCISSNILYTINEPTAITGSLASSANPSCFGFNDGSATITASGGNGIYNYSIDGGTFSPSNTFSGLFAGSHSVNIQDGTGCFILTPVNFNLVAPTPISVGSTTTNVLCFGGNTGSINASASGGTGGYQYSLDNITFQGTTMFSGLSAGSYTIYVKDATNCSSSTTASISQPASGFLVSSSGSTNICSGQAWGETFSASGGTGSITYSWVAQPPANVTGASSGSGNTINEILTATTSNPYTAETVVYDLYATDQNGCNATSTFTVYVNPLPTVSISSDVNPVCLSSIANLSATPTADFFGWNPTTDLTVVNATSATFLPSTTGNFAITYTVAMNTGANCTNIGSLTLTVTPGPSTPILSSNAPVCAGSPINLSSNTIASATYSWSGPNGFTSSLEDPTINIAVAADAGTYTCTINVGGCLSSSTVNVNVNPKPQAIILGASTNFCANQTFTLDGTNSLHNSSSITNYQWQLNGVDIAGANAATYTGNTPGAYKLVVTNDLGCMDTTLTPNVANADPIPTPIINGATSFCTGNSVTLDGLASSAGGASVINNYEWLLNGTSVSSGSTNDSYVASLGGDYQLIILNSNGCKDTTALYTVTENPIPSLPSVTPDPINVCVGSSTNVSVNSPNAGSTYTWASINAETSVSFTTGNSNTVNGLAAGIASITVNETNLAGCTGPTYSVTVNVNNPPIAIASFTSNDTICYNGNASVALNLITGATYSWNSSIGLSSASQSVTFNNITTTGNIQFYGIVTDAAGCASSADTINLFVQNQPTTPVISNASPVCPNQSFTLNVSPVIPGADYYWTDPSTTTQNAIDLTSITIPVATATTAGPYVVSYIDPQGCTSAASSLYNQPLEPTPIVSISGVNTICSGNSTTLTASTSVGTASAYQWFSNGTAIAGATSASYNVTTPGNYNVEIILSTGCFDTASVATTVNVSSGPIITLNPTSSTICAGNPATINASGAATYSWDNGATTASITVNPTVTTSYIVTGTDAGGCTKSDTAVVIVNALPATPTITAGSTTECAGTNVTLSSSSTLPNTWINTSTLAVIGTTQNISHTETGAGVYNYGVYVTDANSCNSATAPIAITFNPCLTNLISDNVSTTSNTPVSGNFLTNDGSPSIFTTVSIVSGPANGAITASSNGNFTYTPSANFSGYNMVVVQVCDATPTCLNDTIYIVVNPNIVGDTYTVNGLSTPNTIIGNVLLNDAGLGIAGNVTLVNSVTNGIIVIDSLGNFTYTPNSGFCGTDLFTYNVCDQNGLCANAGVNLIVTCDSTVTTTTGFSPNGDGVNDNWVIQGIETTENTVTVFDRWGNQVISFTNYNNTNTAWDGKNSNGVELPAGTYFYSIDIPNEKAKKGWVEITK